MKSASALFAFIIFMTGCASTESKFTRPLNSNEARVSGRTASLLNTSSVFIALIDQTQEKRFTQEQVIPVGKVSLILRYNDRAGPFQSTTNDVIAGIEEKYDKKLEINAVGQHEYYADCIIRTLVVGLGDIDYRITDKTTGLIVAETKGKTSTN